MGAFQNAILILSTNVHLAFIYLKSFFPFPLEKIFVSLIDYPGHCDSKVIVNHFKL